MILNSFSKNFFKNLMILLLILVMLCLLGAGIYCAIKLYNNMNQHSETFGTIDYHDVYEEFNIFDCDLSDAVFYRNNEGIYEYKTTINKAVSFNGDNNKYNLLVNNKPSTIENSTAGILKAVNVINYYDIDATKDATSTLYITFKFYQSNVEIEIINTNGSYAQTKFLEYLKFNGLHIRIIDAQYIFTQHVNKRTQPIPENVEIYNIYSDALSVTSLTGAEYSLDKLNWQTSNHFFNLEANTSYTIYVRYAETNDFYASEIVSLQATTRKYRQESPENVVAENITANSITLTQIENGEYSIDNGTNWQDSNVFTNLIPSSTYSIFIRYKETPTHYASASINILATTLESSIEQSAGYYNLNNELLYSWQDMIDNDYISVVGNSVKKGNNTISESGNLVVSNEIIRIEISAFENWKFDNVILPNGLIYIGQNAFRDCTNLLAINLPNTLQDMNINAFRDCSNLTSIIIPENITDIPQHAFSDCVNLKSIILPSSLTHIYQGAFDNVGIDNLILPDNLRYIGPNSFRFNNLFGVDVHIPANVEIIKEHAFQNVREYSVDENNQFYSAMSNVLYNKDKTIIISYPDAKEFVDTFTVPESVTKINDYAFHGVKISSIILPKNVNEICNYAFYGYDLDSVIIQNSSAFEFSEYAFLWYTSQFKIYVNNSVIDDYKTLNSKYADIIFSL